MTGRIERLQKTYEIDVCWRAFPLHPETPEEGTPLERLFSGVSSEELEKMKARVKNAAEEAGLPFGDRTKTYNSRLAQELGKWAETNGKGDAFHHAVFKRYFADRENIAKIPALVDIAVSVGLPRKKAEAVLAQRSYQNVVDEDWTRSRRYGITAIPTFVMQNEKLVGAQPYETLEQFIATKGVAKRAGN